MDCSPWTGGIFCLQISFFPFSAIVSIMLVFRTGKVHARSL